MDVTCRLGCGQRMKLKMLAEHEASLCSERLVPCRWKCMEAIKVGESATTACCLFPQGLLPAVSYIANDFRDNDFIE